MALRTRTEFISPKDTVQLTATFRDGNGSVIDTDNVPQVTITQPNGMVSVSTSAGVMKLSTGKYQYDYSIGFMGPYGVWSDVWQTQINGFNISASFNFVVNTTDQPALNSDGYMHLGDDIPFDFDQTEIFNINKLLKAFKNRLNSSGIFKSVDGNGVTQYNSCDIFSTAQLCAFLGSSLSQFNETPHFTFFTFADTYFIKQFLSVLIQGATIEALYAQSLIEKGKIANITDNGVNLALPDLGEMMQNQANTLMTAHLDRLKFIKNSFKPQPIGLAGYSMFGRNPTYRMLKMLRERQVV